MVEDKLTRAERIRLESLTQAISMGASMGDRLPPKIIFQLAEQIEAWLRWAPAEPSSLGGTKPDFDTSFQWGE